MSKKSERLTQEFEEMLQQDVIGDQSVSWKDCVEVLDDLAAYCQDWAAQIRSEHK